MFKLEKTKELSAEYNYYKEIKSKTDIISAKIFGHNNNEILKQKLYNLVINLCNQVIYDYTYTFTKDDLFFIMDYNINIDRLVNNFKKDIIKMKRIEER